MHDVHNAVIVLYLICCRVEDWSLQTESGTRWKRLYSVVRLFTILPKHAIVSFFIFARFLQVIRWISVIISSISAGYSALYKGIVPHWFSPRIYAISDCLVAMLGHNLFVWDCNQPRIYLLLEVGWFYCCLYFGNHYYFRGCSAFQSGFYI